MISRHHSRAGLVLLFIIGCGTSFVVGRSGQAPTPGPLLTSTTRGSLRMLLDKQELGGAEVSVGERTYPANYESVEHSHKSIEILYVLSGELQHVLNGQTYVLGPGMLGVVKPGDKVRHKAGPQGPTKTLMIWVPGDDGTLLAESWRADRAR